MIRDFALPVAVIKTNCVGIWAVSAVFAVVVVVDVSADVGIIVAYYYCYLYC